MSRTLSKREKDILNSLRKDASKEVHNIKLKDLFVKDTDPMLQYHSRKGDTKTVIGWGQLKLALTEIFYLTYFQPDNVDNPIVVYAGAAPGHHIDFVSKMFPNITWHLYDPSPFGIEKSGNINIHQEVFTDKISLQWANRKDVMFISDIRSVDYKKVSFSENEQGIWKDMISQMRWTELIKPTSAHLKMRLPYFTPSGHKSVEYLKGHVMYQAYTGATSTETRLIVKPNSDGIYEKTTYNIKQYENRLFYNNAITREVVRYSDPIVGGNCIPDQGNMKQDWDSMFMILVMNAYLVAHTDVNMDKKTRFARAIAMSRMLRKDISGHRKEDVSIKKLRVFWADRYNIYGDDGEDDNL